MSAAVPTLALLATSEASIPPAGTAVRTAVRIVLGVLIATLVAYILIEQIGSLRRRRLPRDR